MSKKLPCLLIIVLMLMGFLSSVLTVHNLNVRALVDGSSIGLESMNKEWIDTFANTSKIEELSNLTISDGDVRLDTTMISAGNNPAASNDGYILLNGWTDIDMTNPVSDSGKLTQWQVYAVSTGSVRFKVFRSNGTHLVFVGETPLETFSAGLNTFACNIDVEKGDFIGTYLQSGRLDCWVIGTPGYEIAHVGDINTTLPLSQWEIWNDTLPLRATGFAYEPHGSMVSVSIVPSSNNEWNTLSVNKTEPLDTNITVSVLDGATNETIPGFTSLSMSWIDLSTIDPETYPTLKLEGTLRGTPYTTPVLHDWSVTWVSSSPTEIYSLTVEVQNTTGSLVANATVTVDNLANATTDTSGQAVFMLNISSYMVNASHPDYQPTSSSVYMDTNRTLNLMLGHPYVFEGEISDSHLVIEEVVGGFNICLRNPLQLSPLNVFFDWENQGRILPGSITQCYFHNRLPDLIVVAAAKGSPDFPKAWYKYPVPLELAPSSGSVGAFLPEPVPYAAGSIFISPYPPVYGQPTVVGVTLRNPYTDMTLNISRADFQVSGLNAFGGIWTSVGYVPDISLYPNETRDVSIVWLAHARGHHCVRVVLTYSPYRQTIQRNIDIESEVVRGSRDSVDFIVRNPTHRTHLATLRISTEGAENWEVALGINGISYNVTFGGEIQLMLSPAAIQEMNLAVLNEFAENESVTIDIEGYIENQLIGGIRKIATPQPIPPEPPEPIPDFTLSATPSQQNIIAGEPAVFEVTVTSHNGFHSAVELSGYISGHTPDMLQFNPSSVTPPPNGSEKSTLTIAPTSHLTVGEYSILIAGNSGETTKNCFVTLYVDAVPDFEVSVNPLLQSIRWGCSAVYEITIRSINGFNAEVSFAPLEFQSILDPLDPSDIFLSEEFDKPSVTPPVDGSEKVTLKVTTEERTFPNVYEIKISASSGSITHEAIVRLKVRALYELFIEIDFMDGNEPTDWILNEVRMYYLQRGINMTLYKDDEVPHSDIIYMEDPDGDVAGDFDDWRDFEEIYNDGPSKIDGSLTVSDQRYFMKHKWVLYANRSFAGGKYRLGWTQTPDSEPADEGGTEDLAGNYIVIGKGNCTWWGEYLRENEGWNQCYQETPHLCVVVEHVEWVTLMHEIGHSIGILKLKEEGGEWIEDYDSDGTSVMAGIGGPNCNKAVLPKRYSEEYWGYRNLEYYPVECVDSELRITVESASRVLVQSHVGLKLGVDPITGFQYNEIPGATYWESGTTKQFIIPGAFEGQYSMKILGTGDRFTLSATLEIRTNTHSQSISEEIDVGEILCIILEVQCPCDYSGLELYHCGSVCVGDLNDDGKVDMMDIGVAALAYGSHPGHPRWNSVADISGDQKVDIRDIAMITRNFGNTSG